MSTEDDKIKWRGIKLVTGELYLPVAPYEEAGTQIAKEAEADDTTTIIHTVDTDQELHLNTVMLSGVGTAAAIIQLSVRNVGDTVQYHLITLQFKAGEPAFGSEHFWPCLKIATGWDIIVVSDTANAVAHAFIHGHELDA